MKKGTGLLLICSTLVLILLIIIVKSYSSLSSLKEDVTNKEADINVQLNRKIEQTSNLSIHLKEENVSENIFSKKDDVKNAKKIEEKATINDEISNELNTYFDKINNDEELLNNEEIINLVNEIISTENRLINAIQNYNTAVDDYNAKVKGFPSGIVAKVLGYKTKNTFETKIKLNDFGKE